MYMYKKMKSKKVTNNGTDWKCTENILVEWRWTTRVLSMDSLRQSVHIQGGPYGRGKGFTGIKLRY